MEIVNSIVEFLQGLETASAMVWPSISHVMSCHALLKGYLFILCAMVDYSDEASSPALLFKSPG